MNINLLLDKFTAWAKEQDDIDALALAGSHAAGTAEEDSDIDLIIICEDPDKYLSSDIWTNQFGHMREADDEDHGLVRSKRVFYSNGREVEFGFTTAEWANTDPVDPGTQQVITDGIKILVDKNNLLKNLIEKK